MRSQVSGSDLAEVRPRSRYGPGGAHRQRCAKSAHLLCERTAPRDALHRARTGLLERCGAHLHRTVPDVVRWMVRWCGRTGGAVVRVDGSRAPVRTAPPLVRRCGQRTARGAVRGAGRPLRRGAQGPASGGRRLRTVTVGRGCRGEISDHRRGRRGRQFPQPARPGSRPACAFDGHAAHGGPVEGESERRQCGARLPHAFGDGLDLAGQESFGRAEVQDGDVEPLRGDRAQSRVGREAAVRVGEVRAGSLGVGDEMPVEIAAPEGQLAERVTTPWKKSVMGCPAHAGQPLRQPPARTARVTSSVARVHWRSPTRGETPDAGGTRSPRGWAAAGAAFEGSVDRWCVRRRNPGGDGADRPWPDLPRRRSVAHAAFA